MGVRRSTDLVNDIVRLDDEADVPSAEQVFDLGLRKRERRHERESSTFEVANVADVVDVAGSRGNVRKGK